MSAIGVMRKDILDVRRAKIVWFVGLLFTLVTVLFFYQINEFGGIDGFADVLLGLWNLVFVGALFIPAIALVAAYLSIAGERESGSIKFLLSTPINRRDLVLGKFLSRVTVVTASLLFAFVVAAVLSLVWFSDLMIGTFVAIAALTLLYALAYVAVAIAISASTATRSRAMGGALAFYFLTNLLILFNGLSIDAALDYLLNDLLDLGIGQDPINFVTMLISPTQSYLTSTTLAFPEDFLVNQGLNPDAAAWYVQGEMGLALLLAWLVVPLLIGVVRFERANIG
ncbi:ABC transporter permease subunit [Halovenus sp. WSH3]|uniref:ABC transporter permease subunit n=1 Tax=Halovenus carboxidivorans TaxID=2692199 RepID=A0A6B0TEB5_9EURY|nr:ABC transporter permease subunit [Halovenus carboxidivorans]MXR51539.1 ABC transporter permease subunit [Halovenus carboxidivorans]